MRESRQISYVLHTRAYRETSLLVELFTLTHGRVSAVAKGVRKARSRMQVLPFVRCETAWSGKTQLKTLTEVDAMKYHQLLGNALLSGLYLNELLMRMLQPFDPHAYLFEGYQLALDGLASGGTKSDLEICLREFEKLLLKESGYEVIFDHVAGDATAIEPQSLYTFSPVEGFSQTGSSADPGSVSQGDTSAVYTGSVLLSIAKSDYADKKVRNAAKRIMRSALRSHIGNKPLMSRALFVPEE